MKSNIERIYNVKDYYDILNNSRYLFTPNPYYQVNKFIISIDRSLNINYLLNLKSLGITKSNNQYKSNYDYKSNNISSSDIKSDVFALLHLASNDRNKRYTGIISCDGVGYGLNNGLTDYYTNLINGKKYSYPFEAIVAKILDKVAHKILAKSYFENNSSLLCNSLNIPEYFALDLLELVDNYHDNYIELMRSYRERFEKERYYHNEIFGKYMKEKNKQLTDLYVKIDDLEYTNYILVENIYWLLINIINFSKIDGDTKKIYIQDLNEELDKLFKKEEFNYLNNLTNYFEKKEANTNVKVMKLVK